MSLSSASRIDRPGRRVAARGRPAWPAPCRRRRRRRGACRPSKDPQQRLAAHRPCQEGRVAAGAEFAEHAAVGRRDQRDRLGTRSKPPWRRRLSSRPSAVFHARRRPAACRSRRHGPPPGRRSRRCRPCRHGRGWCGRSPRPRRRSSTRSRRAGRQGTCAAHRRCFGRRCGRDFEDEFRALAQLAGDADGAAHRRRRCAWRWRGRGRRRHACGSTCRRPVRTPRRCGRGRRRAMPGPVSADGEADRPAWRRRRTSRTLDQHAAAVGELDGVADQVEQHLAHAARDRR